MQLGNYRLLRLDSEDNSCLEKKNNWKKNIFHHLYAISETIELWDLIMETKIVLNQKTNWKFFYLRQSMYESAKKSYIILLSCKHSICESWL